MMTAKELKELVGRYRRVFNTKDGQAILADLKKRSFVRETTYSDSHGRMGFNEGRRSLYTYIENMKDNDPEKITDLPRQY